MFVAALCGRDNASCHSPRQERTSGLRPQPEVEAGASSLRSELDWLGYSVHRDNIPKRITSRSPILAALGKACFSPLGMALCSPFVRNNNYSVCNRNCIGGFARDDSLPQHLAAAWPLLAQHAIPPRISSLWTCHIWQPRTNNWR
jgi:hypothetical protein